VWRASERVISMEVPIGGPSMPSSETQEEPAISIAGEEEEAPVEAPPQPPAETATEAPTAPPPGAGAKPGLIGKLMGSKIFMVLAVVGVVVILLAASMIYMMYGVSGVSAVRVIAQDTAWNATDVGLKIFVVTESLGSSSFSGDADVKITYENSSTVTYRGKISMSNDEGSAVIPYEEFLDEPGSYKISVSAGGKSVTGYYYCNKLANVVGLFNVDARWTVPYGEWVYTDPEVPEYGVFGTVTFGDEFNPVAELLPGTIIDIRLYEGETLLDSDTDIDIVEWIWEGDAFKGYYYPFQLDYDDPGNFTVEATIHNPVIESSGIYEVVVEVPETYYNARPLVDAGPNQTANPTITTDDTIYFDVHYLDENKNDIDTSTNENDADIKWTFPEHDEGDDDRHDYGENADNDYAYEDKGATFAIYVSVLDPDMGGSHRNAGTDGTEVWVD